LFGLRAGALFLVLALAMTAVWQLLPTNAGTVRSHQATGGFVSRVHDGLPYLLYVPSSASATTPNGVFVAIHGMGAEPEGFASGLIADAERNGWVMVVPHLPYGDWTQAESLKGEERRQMAWLDSLLPALPEVTGLPLQAKALFYGFSRGAQLSHRFALAYPHRVLAAAIMAPGTYTLPLGDRASSENRAALSFPVGVSDLDRYCGRPFDAEAVRKVAFWVGVGEKDNAPEDVPRLWDRYMGKTRLERARSFTASLLALGTDVELNVFADLGHSESAESRASAVSFLRKREVRSPAPVALGARSLAVEEASLALPR
jgi:predicted esterase